jgi:hypothetical protein
MINSLIFALSCLDLQPGEEKWIHAPIRDSYEYQIVNGEGALSIPEYRSLFESKRLKIRHLEVERKLIFFNNTAELKEWIRTEMAPQFNEEGNERFVEDYFELMQQKGFFENQGKIGFPRQSILVLLTR